MKWGDYITLEYGKPVSDKASKEGPVPVFGTNGPIGTSFLKPLCGFPSVIIGRKGAYRGVKYSPVPFSVIDTAFYVNPISDEIDMKWLYYKFLTYDINGMDSGSAIPSTDRYMIYDIDVDLPPLPTQRRIAAVLSALDDKIENNRKICENLEAQAQAIFKEWFVDFGPWGGKMPEGWRMGALGDIASVSRKSITPQKMPKTVEHFSLPAYDTRKLPTYDSSSSIKSNKFLITKDSILISKLNPSIKRLWDPSVESDCAVSSTEFVVIEAKNRQHRSFVYAALDGNVFYEYARSHAAGTTNSHQRVAPEEILNFNLTLPTGEVLDQFCTMVTPMYGTIKNLIKESAALASMRDALLPKLMSGEIDVEKVLVGAGDC